MVFGVQQEPQKPLIVLMGSTVEHTLQGELDERHREMRHGEKRERDIESDEAERDETEREQRFG